MRPRTASSAGGNKARRPNRGQTETHLADRVTVQCDDRTRRGYRIVTGSPFHLAVRAPGARPDRQADLGDDLGRADDRLEGAGAKPAYRHDPLAARALDHDFRTDRTERGGQILGGVGVTQRPPMVPRFRTTGSAITRSAS